MNVLWWCRNCETVVEGPIFVSKIGEVCKSCDGPWVGAVPVARDAILYERVERGSPRLASITDRTRFN